MELIELLEFLGMDKVMADKPLDELKPLFNAKFKEEKYILEDKQIINKITGKRMNVITGLLAKLTGKSIDTFKVNPDDPNAKKFEDFLTEQWNEKQAEIDKLKADSGKNNDEKITQLEAELATIKTERNNYKQLSEDNAAKAETAAKEKDKAIHDHTLRTKLNEIRTQIPYIDDVKESSKRGLEVMINENYDFVLDEKMENVLVKDKSGNLVQSKSKASMATPLEIYIEFGNKDGLIKNNGQKQPDKKNQYDDKNRRDSGDGDDDKEIETSTPSANRKTDLLKRGRRDE